MAEHTKEPWFVREVRDDCFISAATEPGMAYGPEIMGDDYTDYGDSDRKKADARRIVACVNACAGVPTEWLEINKMPILLDVVNAEKQRDELLAALEQMVAIHEEPSGFVGKWGKALDEAVAAQQRKIDGRLAAARAAIAKAMGEQP